MFKRITRWIMAASVIAALSACGGNHVDPVDSHTSVTQVRRTTTTTELPTCSDTEAKASEYLALYLITDMTYYQIMWLEESSRPCQDD